MSEEYTIPGRRHAPYDAAALRRDTWANLQVHVHWLEQMERESGDTGTPMELVRRDLGILKDLEQYWAWPGITRFNRLFDLLDQPDIEMLWREVHEISRLVAADRYRDRVISLVDSHRHDQGESGKDDQDLHRQESRPYFEVLVVNDEQENDQAEFRERLLECRREEDQFVYNPIFVNSFEDAVIAALFNYTIETCLVRYNFAYQTDNDAPILRRYLELLEAEHPRIAYGFDRSVQLAEILRVLRPELDLFLLTDATLETSTGRVGQHFRRSFDRLDNAMEVHLSILKGIRERYKAPFFEALRHYSTKPTGVFHALPVARGKSLSNSHWCRDLRDFYGDTIFLAETSSTAGGLDSLLQPHGPIKEAQEKAAIAFGADRTYFVTNGTSSANKIVVQALVSPDDIVLVSHDCHKSHHYALMLSGAYPIYMDAYPLEEFSFFGAVTIRQIKKQLLELKAEGKLDKVRMLLLTNCTFDGITYNPIKVMQEILAIKPDMIFLWDEAWFAFAGFEAQLRKRTAMCAAEELREMFQSDEYTERYAEWKAGFDRKDPGQERTWLDGELMADPELARVRVYATQSTHKTLTSMRQGSMIHVADDEFEHEVEGAFDEAFMTHTSTSPNYQILASLDVGRRQVQLEGYELVQRSVSLAMALRERIYEDPIISECFHVLRPADLIPAEFRPSGMEYYYDPKEGWARMEQAWREDEFTLDPTRVTLHIGLTGIDGDQFRHLLMDEYDIQVNKTSRNTILLMTNIGTTRGDIANLVEVLGRIAKDVKDSRKRSSDVEQVMRQSRIESLTHQIPPLPNFSRFHDLFRPDPESRTPEGDMRKAFYMAYDKANCEYLKLDGSIIKALESGRDVVSATFVTPYPPGFPILVPGQIISDSILRYLRAVDVKEIHGYNPRWGLKVFTQEALQGGCEHESIETGFVKSSSDTNPNQ
ncbi:MAG: ornithine decarboxylase [Phycisphaerae bacterium]|nr:ornithine decarboxylase [Phycisphaerae bacterium]